LGISQAKELVESGKFLYPVFSSIPMNTDVELMSGKILEQLPENCFAGIHRYPPGPKIGRKVSFQANSNQKKNNYIKECNNSDSYGRTVKIYRTVV
jgi:hypothetical protein